MTKILFSLVFGFSSLLHAEELSTQLQKACIQEQLNAYMVSAELDQTVSLLSRHFQ